MSASHDAEIAYFTKQFDSLHKSMAGLLPECAEKSACLVAIDEAKNSANLALRKVVHPGG